MLIKKLKRLLAVILNNDHKKIRVWERNGNPSPPPHAYKQRTIKKYQKEYNIKVLVETGTYLGDMVYACRNSFERIYSIELDRNLALKAKERFKKYRHILIEEGDSANILKGLLYKLDSPILFWLDGHYSEGNTAKAQLNTPILQELMHISQHKNKSHIILIDDARCFTGQNDYPTIESLEQFIKERMPLASLNIEHDIIIITP